MHITYSIGPSISIAINQIKAIILTIHSLFIHSQYIDPVTIQNHAHDAGKNFCVGLHEKVTRKYT